MKAQYSYILFIAGLLTIFSCTKETEVTQHSYSGEEVTISLIATTPDCSVRTVLGDETGRKSISWADKDSIAIYYGTSATSFKDVPVGEGGEINFRVQTSATKNFYSVCPHTVSAKMNSATEFRITIPQEQNGSFAEACIMAAWAGTDRLLRFQMASSLVVIDIKDNAVTKVVLRANDGTPIAGNALLEFDQESGVINKITLPENGAKEIILNVSGSGRYYVALLPDVNLKAGIGFNVYKDSEASGALSRTALPLDKGQLRILGEIDSQVLPSGDIFIKEDGLGKGTSWADAAGPETLDRLLNARISDNVCFDGTTSAWRLGKRKIYLAKGNYTLGTGTLPFTFTAGSGSIEIIGGFYEGSTGKDLTQYAPGTNQTVFTAAKGVRIADVIGTEGGSITLKGITFKGADTSTDGAALNINTDGTLNLTDCTFTGNTTTACGAGLYVSSGRINLDGCRFEQNQAVTTMAPAAEESDTFLYGISRGGAIFAVGKDTDLYLTGCKFRSNLAFVGADIELQKGADAYAYNSYFIGGLAQAGNNFKNYPGRSINADAMPSGEIGALCLCNCTFTKTSSAYTSNGGLPIVAPTNYYCMLVSCTLHDGAVASVRNNNITTRTTTNPDLIWLINNLFVNSAGNAVNLGSASVRHGFYNIMEKGKNSYAELDPTDSKVAELDFTTMKYNSEEGYYSWSIDEKQHPVNKPTRAFVSETVQTNCPDFHAWLMSINNNAYGLDQLGTLRNPGAMYPGAWDKGL
ncbi:MAG: hypothetical protein MJY62_00815 [Bacteroidales bacterium]|nr:hypothetical protein [Bacteroidales bacterium]